MILRIIVALILLSAVRAQARDNDFSIFVGGGLMIANSQATGITSTPSKFVTQGYFAEGGMGVPLSRDWGWALGGEIGHLNAVNTLQSETYMEIGQMDFYAVKTGLYMKNFGAGVGYRKADLTIKSLSIETDEYIETNYGGFAPYFYGSFAVEFQKRYRAALEGIYQDATFKSGSGLEIKYKEMSVGVRVFLMFD